MATPNTKPVTLSDGSTAEVPDGLDPASENSFIARLDAANNATIQQRSNLIAQPGPELFPSLGAKADAIKAAVASGLSKAGSAITSVPGLGWTGTAANMGANVGADVAALPWDAPASVVNAVTQTAKNYGYAQGAPDIPYFAPKLKSDAGVTPTSGTWAPRIENALMIASTLGEGFLPSLFKGAVMEGLGEGGSYVGGKVAENTDPRLAPILQTGGAIVANGLPLEQGGSLLTRGLRDPEAGKTYDAAMQTQADVNAANPNDQMTRPPITLGQVGTPFVKGAERVIGAAPILGIGVESARTNAKEGMVQGRDTAATAVGADPANTTPNASGDALYWGVPRNLNDVGQRMESIENTIANNTQGPGGGAAFMDPHELLDRLNGLKWTMDPTTGRVYSPNEAGVNSMIDAEVAKVNQNRVPEDQAVHAQAQSDIAAATATLSNPASTPQAIQQATASLLQAQSTMDANLKIPFQVARQMKTMAGYSANQSLGQQPTLYDHLAGKNVDAYRDAIQNHVNGLDPQLGAQYQDLNSQYKAASDANRAIGGRNEGTLTSMMRTGMTSPSEVAEVSQTPVWNQAAGNQIRATGQNPKGEFVPRDFAATWDAMTPQAKALYTQTHPGASETLDNVSQLARKFNIPPEAGGMTKSLAYLEALNRVIEHIGLKGALGAAPLGYMAESMPAIRAVAGRPQPYLRTLNQNLPALAAVAAQQRNQPGATP
jgi:hypothetical protein